MNVTYLTTNFNPILQGAVVKLEGYSLHAEQSFGGKHYYIVKDVNFDRITVTNYYGNDFEVHLHDLDDSEEDYLRITILLEPPNDELPF